MPTATSLHPLWDRADEWRCRLDMIRDAQEFLYLSTFYLEYDEYGTALLDALHDAQRRGVAVNLLIDGFGQLLGSVLMTAAHRRALAVALDDLKRDGGVVTFYRPDYYLQRRLGGGQHVKIQVSEAGEAIFGSSNITRSSFEGWNEYSVSLRGPAVQTLLESYRTIGGKVEDAHLERLQESTAPQPVPPDPIELEYWLYNPNLQQGPLGPIGWRGPNSLTDKMITLVREARRSIELTSFFFKPVPALMQAVLDAARQGVRVELYHSHRDALPATDLAWIAAAVNYERLLEAGVRIYENRHGEHSKIVLVDRTRVAFGSYNFEDAAHDRLAEAMIETSDRRGVDPAARIFDELRHDPDNVPVTTDSLRLLPTSLRRRIRLFGPFKRWM